MGARDHLETVIEALRERHGLLAAYLEAAGSIDWRAFHQPASIGKLVAVVDPERRKASIRKDFSSFPWRNRAQWGAQKG
jgi:hypothetical protein